MREPFDHDDELPPCVGARYADLLRGMFDATRDLSGDEESE